jgi:peptide chain release factor 2
MSYFAAVRILPLDPDSDSDSSSPSSFSIPPSDLKIETMKASGAGGQSVNTTDSAVRITHIPTGTVSYCQLDRSQHRNRATALQWLRAKLLEAELQKKEDEKRVMRKLAPRISFGSGLVRTYSLNPTEMLKDWETGWETRDVWGVLEGGLDELLEARCNYFLKEERGGGGSRSKGDD